MKKIIWALDPFVENPKLLNQAARALQTLKKQFPQANTEAVYCLNPKKVDSMGYMLGLLSLKDYRQASEERLKKVLKQLKLGAIEGRVLENEEASTGGAVRALVQHAEKSGADMILTASHANSFTKRLLLGSFAENLLMKSSVPVLIVDPFEKVTSQFKKILYPTDFTDESYAGFKELLKEFGGPRLSVTLLHQILDPVVPTGGNGAYILGQNYIPPLELRREQEKFCKARYDVWSHFAKTEGVKTQLVLRKTNNQLADAIARFGKSKGFDLIAMSSQVGPLEVYLIGSVARHVVRASKLPVWTVRVDESHIEKIKAHNAVESQGSKKSGKEKVWQEQL